MSLYSRARNKLILKLEKYGIKYQCIRSGAITIENGVEVEAKEQQFKITGIKSDYSIREIDGSVIQSGDIRLVCTPTHDLKINDIVIVDDERYLVKEPNPVKPADILICYKPQLRKA